MKDNINKFIKPYVVHQFWCPECNSKYIGKIEQNYDIISVQVINNYFQRTCKNKNSIHTYAYHVNSIQENSSIIHSEANWNALLIKIDVARKTKEIVLNSDLKASKELQLFN